MRVVRDRGLGPAAHDAAHFHTAQHRKVQVEDDQIGRLFGHSLERVIEFVFLDVNAVLPGLLKLLKDLLGLVDPTRVAFQFHPAFARRHFDA